MSRSGRGRPGTEQADGGVAVERVECELGLCGNAQRNAARREQAQAGHATEQLVAEWEVRIEQEDGNWVGIVTSDNPRQILQTPNLSGVFAVRVTASGPEFGPTELTPLPDSKPDVGCNSNCAAMVGIVASPDAVGANYWTVWDAFCSRD